MTKTLILEARPYKNLFSDDLLSITTNLTPRHQAQKGDILCIKTSICVDQEKTIDRSEKCTLFMMAESGKTVEFEKFKDIPQEFKGECAEIYAKMHDDPINNQMIDSLCYDLIHNDFGNQYINMIILPHLVFFKRWDHLFTKNYFDDPYAQQMFQNHYALFKTSQKSAHETMAMTPLLQSGYGIIKNMILEDMSQCVKSKANFFDIMIEEA